MIKSSLDKKLKSKFKLSVYEAMLICGCALSVVLVYLRICFGTELTDEAFYVSDALAMLRGNIPYAYNNFFYGTGSAFLLVPQLFFYQLLVPDCEGIFLFTRISYVTFCLIFLLMAFRIMCKFIRRPNALLLLGFMILYSASGTGGIANYSYNSIPMILCYFTGFLIYDSVEYADSHSFVKLVVSGFLSGIAVLAHPGYGLAVIIFMLLIAMRSARECRVNYLYGYIVGGVMELLVVMVPIICQVGIRTLWEGISMLIHPYPAEPMTQVSSKSKVLEVLIYSWPILKVMAVLLAIAVLCYIGAGMKHKKRRLKDYLTLGITAGILINLVFFCKTHNAPYELYSMGILGSICVGLQLIFGIYKDYPVLLYIGIYPCIFAAAEVIVVGSSASVSRFGAAVPALAVVLFVILENDNKLIRSLAAASAAICILLAGYEDYFYVYRDEPIWNLDCRVSEGVYKGIRTTKERAEDLPELEAYLDSVIEDDEYYAFRDNVPCGYLMVHQGKMCDAATWDVLQYTYNRNTPAGLYAYYKRRNAIPDKIIYVDYVDYRRDCNLSIEDEAFRYNDFVESYYGMVDDRRLNGTFYRVKVYQYQGGFDGDFDYWIDTYKEIP